MFLSESWNIALLSLNSQLYTTRRLADEARRRGHTTHVLNYLRCYMTLETNAMKMHYGERTITGYHVIIPRIGASQTYYGTTVIRQFEAIDTVTTVSSNGLLLSRDKLVCHQVLAENGIGVPKTAFAHSPEEIDKTIEIVGGAPVIIKILKGTQGLGVVIAETLVAAQSVIEAFRAVDTYVVVQEYVADARGRDVRAFVVGGEVIASMQRSAIDGEFRANVHRGGIARRVDLTEEEIETALAVAQIFDLEVVGVDMIRSERGPLVIDVNTSPGFQGMEDATGIDVAGAIIDRVEELCEARFG